MTPLEIILLWLLLQPALGTLVGRRLKYCREVMEGLR